VLQEDTDLDESYINGPNGAALPEHWQSFSNAASRQQTQVGSTRITRGPAAAAEEASKVGLVIMPPVFNSRCFVGKCQQEEFLHCQVLFTEQGAADLVAQVLVHSG
jgi:hypothetical protein